MGKRKSYWHSVGNDSKSLILQLLPKSKFDWDFEANFATSWFSFPILPIFKPLWPSCDKIVPPLKTFPSFFSEKKPGGRGKEPELDIEEKILRRREMAHLFQWYYPEGGWGWVILVCAFISQSLAHGLQLGFAYPLGVAIRRRFYLPAEETSSNETNHDRSSLTISSDYSGHDNNQRHIEANHIGKQNCFVFLNFSSFIAFYWLVTLWGRSTISSFQIRFVLYVLRAWDLL